METEEDMETSLVQQFNCLGTTDKDVLIAQLQKLVGPQLNASAAQFFLDMNNWNLQLAVGAYFDLTDDDWSSSTPTSTGAPVIWSYSMTLVDDISSDESVLVPPNTQFIKRWRVRNSGGQAWPPGTHLRFRSGPKNMCGTETVLIDGGGGVEAGEVRTVSIQFTSPPEPGNYHMRWQMASPEGYLFGDEIWAIVNVALDLTADLTQQLQSLSCDQDAMS